MAGVEAAGFILAVFPLLISAAEDYQRGFEPLLKWKRFRTEFIGFIDAVDIERHLFSQMMERFLISADVPHEELHRFMTDPEYKGWKGQELVNILQARLGPSYEAYMSTLRTMNRLMLDLQELLCLKDGKVDWSEGGGWDYRYQLKRIRLSFSKKGARTVASLETHNRKLRELLDSSDKLESLKSTRKDTSWGDVFASIREHAASLHSAIKKSWNCNCSSPHKADLRLQSRSAIDASSAFNIRFEAPQMSNPPSVKRREVVISARKELPKDPPSQPPPSFWHQVSNQESYTEQLRRNFEAKLTPTVSHSSVISIQSSPQEVFSRSNSGQSTNTSISCINGTEIMVADSSSRKWLPKSEKAKKSVRMHLPEPQTLLSPPQTVMSTSLPDIQLELRPKTSPPSTEIHDLCSVIGGSIGLESPGYLVDHQERQFDVNFLSGYDSVSPGNDFISLDNLLRGHDGISLNRRERYQIASILASSVLQLQSTPWLTERLNKGNILFSKHGLEIVLEHPYLRHSFESVKATPINLGPAVSQPALRFAARNSLSDLGIVLLELCFGQVIEDQALRRIYLGNDGKPHDSTDYMTARDWVDEVSEEEPELDSVIRKCVFCVFEEKADWSNRKFTAAVYYDVVEPLQKINSRWTAT